MSKDADFSQPAGTGCIQCPTGTAAGKAATDQKPKHELSDPASQLFLNHCGYLP
jgi:hypothetical protein